MTSGSPSRAGGPPAGLGSGQLFEGGSIWNPPPPAVVVPHGHRGRLGGQRLEEGPLGYPVWRPARAARRRSGRVRGRRRLVERGHRVPRRGRADRGPLPRGRGAGRRAPLPHHRRTAGCATAAAPSGSRAAPSTGPPPPGLTPSGAPSATSGPPGAEDGGLGYPTSGEICGLRDGGCYQGFQGGAIYWSPATGAHGVLGAIRDAWARQGGRRPARLPVTGENCGLAAAAATRRSRAAPSTGPPPPAPTSPGAIRDTWARQGLGERRPRLPDHR